MNNSYNIVRSLPRIEVTFPTKEVSSFPIVCLSGNLENTFQLIFCSYLNLECSLVTFYIILHINQTDCSIQVVSHATPIIKSYAAAPVLKSYAPAISYAAPATVVKSYAAPAISYQPTLLKSYAAAPALELGGYDGHGYGYH